MNDRGAIRAAILLVAMGFPAVASAQDSGHWFRLDRSSLFPDWPRQVQELVDQKPNAERGQICVLGWRGRSADTIQAYVIWPEGDELVTWFPTDGDPHSLVDETRVLDLRRDVVADQAAVGTSTYLVTRAWVRDLEHRCRRVGDTLVLAPRTVPSRR